VSVKEMWVGIHYPSQKDSEQSPATRSGFNFSCISYFFMICIDIFQRKKQVKMGNFSIYSCFFVFIIGRLLDENEDI